MTAGYSPSGKPPIDPYGPLPQRQARADGTPYSDPKLAEREAAVDARRA
jgi:hypothetical protein